MPAPRALTNPSSATLEALADALLHAVALAGAVWAAQLAVDRSLAATTPIVAPALAVYVLGMFVLGGASAAYNLTLGWLSGRWLRRIDHASIFFMIAGTYTPFCLLALGGRLGTALLVLVWTLALLGAAMRLAGWPRREGVASLGYLAVGWVVVIALIPLAKALDPLGLALLGLGGVLYSVGVVFYLWRELPFQRVIWHAFVVAGATTHAIAVFQTVVPPS